MKEVKTIECEKGFASATGTYFGVPPKHEQQLMIGDVAELRCEDVTVMARIALIDGNDITGTIVEFEDLDAESINGVALGDDVRFKRDNLKGWKRP